MADRWQSAQREDIRVRDQIRDGGDGPVTPASCPACRSRELTTTSKVVNADSYWRCCACGEVWNAARLRAGSRYQRDTPFRR